MDYNLKQYLDYNPEAKELIELFTLDETTTDFKGKLKSIFERVKDNYLFKEPTWFVDRFFYLVCSIDYYLKVVEKEENESYLDYFHRFIDLFEYVWIKDDDSSPFGRSVGKVWFEKDKWRDKATLIDEFSLVTYFYNNSDWPIYPILYPSHFDRFVDCCNALGIEVPPIPPQSKAKERCHFFLDLCEKIDQFRMENELSKPEVCALLYGYAVHLTERPLVSVKKEDLPAPTRIWLTGASKEDYKSALNEETSIWAGNEETRRGDIVIIYALNPHSHIHSVWRAVEDGNINPFNYYCNRITVSQKIEVPHVTSKELKEDEYMKNVSIVRKNLQGINGWELTIEDYNRLLFMFKQKGFDTSCLPAIERPELNLDVELKVEKDVEEKLLIPLLEKLGYESNSDWSRQVVVKLGRKEKYIPDFVFFPKELSSSQVSAPFVIEAKYDMYNSSELRKAFDQGVSYARPLGSTFMGICDKKSLRIYKQSSQGLFSTSDIVFDDYWSSLQKPEVFNKLQKLIGKEEIAKLKRR